jgi:hypothetical protein
MSMLGLRIHQKTTIPLAVTGLTQSMDLWSVMRITNPGKHSGYKMVWPSEVLWQCWKSTALGAGELASDLRAIVRLTIIDEASQIAIRQASKHSSSSRIDDHNQIDHTRLDNGFYANLGTPNGASTMRTLRDHRTELGHRIVEKIVVFGEEDPTMKMAKTRSIVVLLSDRRSPPVSNCPSRFFFSPCFIS